MQAWCPQHFLARVGDMEVVKLMCWVLWRLVLCIVHCTGGHHSGHICLWGHGAMGETDPEGLGWQLPVIVGTHKQI